MGGGSGQSWTGCLPRDQVASVGKLWFIVGCYLAPKNTATTNSVVVAIGQHPYRAALLVAGYFNTDMTVKDGNSCGSEIVAAIATAVLEDMSAHFLPHCKSWARDGRTWYVLRQWREVQYRMEYLLRTDCHLFWKVSVRDPWHTLNHLVVLGRLFGVAQRKHSRYLWWHQRFPIRPLQYHTQEVLWFYSLRQALPKQPPRELWKNECISDET